MVLNLPTTVALIDRLADQGVVWTQSVEGLGWTEVDCPADLERAARLVVTWPMAGVLRAQGT